MLIVQHARAPVMARRQRHAKRAEFDALPMIELMHDVETEIVHEIPDADAAPRSADRLRLCAACAGRGDRSARASRGRNRSIGRWKSSKPGRFRRLITFSHIDQFGSMRMLTSLRLHEERRVPDPGDADFALSSASETAAPARGGALREERRDEDAGEEVALVPVSARPQARHAWRMCHRRSPDAWTIFFRLFLEKGIGTTAEPYNLAEVNQTLRAGERER